MADERPADLETKDTRGTLLGYIPSAVPNENRVGEALTEDERRRADERGDLSKGLSGVSEEDHQAGQFGITSDSAGKQTSAAATEDAAPAAKRSAK